MEQIWNEEKLSLHWTLTFKEIELVKIKPTKSWIGFCIQLKYYQFYGRFPNSSEEISEPILEYISVQLEINKSTFKKYEWNGRTCERHQYEILKFLNIKKITQKEKQEHIKWLVENIFPNGYIIDEAIELSYNWFMHNRVEPPAVQQLKREISSSYNDFEDNLFAKITDCIPISTIQNIDLSLEESNDSEIGYNKLKSDPGKTSLKTVLDELTKLEFINTLELPFEIIASTNPKIISRLRQRILSENAWEIRRHPKNIRYALMSIFFYSRKSEIIDGLIELLILIIHKMSTKAKNKVIENLVRNIRTVYGKDRILNLIAEAALDFPDNTMRERIYPIAGEQTLKDIVKEYKSKGKEYHTEIYDIIRSSYSNHYKRMVPKILNCLVFHSNNTIHRPVLDALEWVNDKRDSKRQYYYLSEGFSIEGIIKPKWRDTTIEKDDKGIERINRINYEICVLETLREKLRCKEIWVEGADKFRNPDEDLPQDFQIKREFYYNELGITQDATEFVDNLKKV